MPDFAHFLHQPRWVKPTTLVAEVRKGRAQRAVKLLSRDPCRPTFHPFEPVSGGVLPARPGNVFRVDDAQDVLNDLPFGQFGEGPHAVDMGAKGHSNSKLAVPFKPEPPKRQHGLAGRVDARGTAWRNARARSAMQWELFPLLLLKLLAPRHHLSRARKPLMTPIITSPGVCESISRQNIPGFCSTIPVGNTSAPPARPFESASAVL
jgi:hypothetical protein